MLQYINRKLLFASRYALNNFEEFKMFQSVLIKTALKQYYIFEIDVIMFNNVILI